MNGLLENEVDYEREISAFYGRQIWRGSVKPFLYHSDTGAFDPFHGEWMGHSLSGGHWSFDLYLLPDAYQKCFQDVCPESEVFEYSLPGSGKME